jgi:hypothetical protein
MTVKVGVFTNKETSASRRKKLGIRWWIMCIVIGGYGGSSGRGEGGGASGRDSKGVRKDNKGYIYIYI